jgi:monoamine oxidase
MTAVVVVGAGIAGLSVTAMLAAAGLDVHCLEASNRVGGRLLSSGAEEGSFDLGATWFWAGEHRVQTLVGDLGIETFAQYTAGDALYEDGRRVRRLQGNPIDGPAFRYVGGAQALADGLAATLPAGTVARSCRVSAISADGDGLSVHTDGGTLRAAHVVLAVPPALAMSRIRFEPALPERLAATAAATPVWMGAVRKVVVQYAEPFWRADGLSGAALSNRGPLQELHDMSGPEGHPAALFGFAAPDGADLSTDAVVAQLVRLFGPGAATPVRVVVRDWGGQPDTSPPGVADLQDYRHFGSPLFAEPALGGRLHWASTETSQVSPGHVEGALAAAERTVARLTVALLRRAAAMAREG